MPHLPPDLHNAIVEVLTPHTRTLQDRESILIGVLPPEVLQNRIAWSSPTTAFQFATGLIDKLTHHELVAVLRQLGQIVGVETQERVDSLAAQVTQNAATQRTTVNTPQAAAALPPPTRPAKVFLSHAAADAQPAKAVAEILARAGLEVWLELDRIKPGEPWLTALEVALEASTHFVVLVGPSGVERWVEREMRYALERNTRDNTYGVIPILLGPPPAQPPALPIFLKQHQYLSLDWRRPDPAAVQEIVASIRGASPPQQVSLLAPGESPFRGLLTFDDRHAHLFFGRDAEVGELLARLQSGIRFLPILGDSGSGKSSLVQAGLVPSLLRGRLGMDTDWRIATMTPGDDPLGELAKAILKFDPGLDVAGRAAALASAKTSLQPKDGSVPAADALADIFAVLGLPPSSRQLLVIDQFEQLFTLAPAIKDEKDWLQSPAAQFIDIVFRGVERPNSSLQAVITFRVDFVGLCHRHRELWARVLQDQYDLRRMHPDRLRDVITKPLALAGMAIDDNLADRLIDDVGDQPGGLALLEHALDELWKEAKAASPTREHYNTMGGLKGALARHADGVLKEKLATDGQRDIARRIFVALTVPGEGTEDSARRVPKAKLEDIDPGAAAEVLQILAGQRLVVIDKDAVTIAHEALIREWPTLQGWLKDRRKDIEFERDTERVAEKWKARGQDKDLLFKGKSLSEALEWRSRNASECLPPIAPFIEESAKSEEASRKRERRDRIRNRSLLAAVGPGIVGGLFWLALPRIQAGLEAIQAERNRATLSKLLREPRVNEKDRLTYVYIPPGSVVSAGDLHAIEMKEGFWIGQTEVTQEAFERVAKKLNPSGFKGPNRPVESVYWKEASEYCEAVGLSLPTEEQWEYAARAGGNEDVYGNLNEIAWNRSNSKDETHPVGILKPNPWGLHDMLGNVWEWTRTADGGGKVVRGGAWNDIVPEGFRVSFRSGVEAASRSSNVGFRCAGELR